MTVLQLLRSAVRGDYHDHTRGSVRTAILLLAVPMMLEMAMESIFSLVDTYFVGRVGVAALTTVGLTEVMLTLIYSVAVGLSMAPMAMVSRFVGEGRPEQARRVAGQSVVVALIVSLFIAVPGYYYAPDLLRLMGASEEVVAQGAGYTRIMFATNGVIVLLFVLNGVFRGAGEAARAMRVLWIANGINIVLDPIFIFGLGPIPALGVEGAAVATTIGRGCGVLLQFYYLLNGTSVVRLTWTELRPDGSMLRRIGNVAATGALQYLVASASWVFLMRIVAGFGDAAAAGYTVAVRLILFTMLPAWGLSNAAATFVGQNLGADQPDRAQRGVIITLRIISVYLLVLSFGYYFGARTLVQGFTMDAASLAAGTTALRIFAIGYVLFGVGTVAIQAFNGAGDTRTPTLVNLACFWALELPLGYWLAVRLDLGVGGVVWAVVIAQGVLAVTALWLFRRGRWKLVEV